MTTAEIAYPKVNITEEDKRLLDGVLKEVGMTQQEALGRLIHWFAQQERLLQSIVLRQIPDDYVPDILILMLKRAQGGSAALWARLEADLKKQRDQTRPGERPGDRQSASG